MRVNNRNLLNITTFYPPYNALAIAFRPVSALNQCIVQPQFCKPNKIEEKPMKRLKMIALGLLVLALAVVPLIVYADYTVSGV